MFENLFNFNNKNLPEDKFDLDIIQSDDGFVDTIVAQSYYCNQGWPEMHPSCK